MQLETESFPEVGGCGSGKLKAVKAPRVRGRRHSFLLEEAHDGRLLVGFAGCSPPFLSTFPLLFGLPLCRSGGGLVADNGDFGPEILFTVRAGFTLVDLFSY